MKRQTLISIFVIVLLLAAVAWNVSNALAEDTLNTDAIAGTWSGNMHFSVSNSVERVKIFIPAGCETGETCGTLLNYANQCVWEITYDAFSDGVYQYHFSNTLQGDCPAGSSGLLTLLPEGTLYRTHTTPMFTATGYLRQLPNAK